ncbi:MAG TPA: DUF4352 domain-containing protein, partial [Thermomicrobiales bacterium]|nr:DUF4352 domain-containing protein [Thermomicrobiales bacterium]
HRRALLTMAVIAGGGALASGRLPRDAAVDWTSPRSAAAQSVATPTPMVGRADAPRWTFTVLLYQDPYAGKLSRPTEPEPGTRYIFAEVVIDNGSDQPLDFAISDVRLVDVQGVEYPASSSVLGSEPKLTGQNLPDGERTRGAVWFAVPTDARFNEIKFNGPSPRFVVPLPGPAGG